MFAGSSVKRIFIVFAAFGAGFERTFLEDKFTLIVKPVEATTARA